jgi:hypothetical protein
MRVEGATVNGNRPASRLLEFASVRQGHPGGLGDFGEAALAATHPLAGYHAIEVRPFE